MATITTTTPPSDLTGYTVIIQKGWTAYRGYGIFDIQGIFSDSTYGDNEFYSLYVGYALNFDTHDYEPSAGAIVYGGYANTMPNGNPLSFSITGGSDVSRSSLIQWLVDNKATFTKEVEEETPTNSKMKLEVLYKGEVIGLLSAGESLALHLNGSKLTEDLVVRAVGMPLFPK